MNSIGLKRTTFYLIRHKATQQIMPLTKRNRGYSWWNPARIDTVESRPQILFLDVPRLLKSEEQAKRCILQWFTYPNGRNSITQSYSGECDDIVDFKEDGRKKEDLEVVKIRIVKL